MSDLYEPYEALVPVVVLGRVWQVPENNTLLRQLQFVAPEVGYGRFCWNAECRTCRVRCLRPDRVPYTALACRLQGRPGLRVTGLSAELRRALARVLAAAEPSGG